MSFRGTSCNTLVEGAGIVGTMVSPEHGDIQLDKAKLKAKIEATYQELHVYSPCMVNPTAF